MLMIITEKLHAIQKAILLTANENCVAIKKKQQNPMRNFEAEKKYERKRDQAEPKPYFD